MPAVLDERNVHLFFLYYKPVIDAKMKQDFLNNLMAFKQTPG